MPAKFSALVAAAAILITLTVSGSLMFAATVLADVAPVQVGTTTTPAVPMVVATAAQPSVLDTGSIAGQALIWMATTFGGAAGTAIVALLLRLLKQIGMKNADALRYRLQEIVVNGINLGAQKAAESLKGRGQVEIRNAAVASAIDYTRLHASDVLRELGVDPSSPAAVEAIKARIESAVADPATPTSPALKEPSAAWATTLK